MRRSLLVALVLVICVTIYLSGWKRLDPDTNLLLLDTANNADEAVDTPIILPREEEVSTTQDYEQAENLDDSKFFPTNHPPSPVLEETEAPTSKAPGRDETDAENLIDLALLDSEARNNNIPKQPRRNQEPVGGAFIHLGKTGGSTLTSFLRNGCIHHLRKPCSVIANETIASRLITHYYHGKFEPIGTLWLVLGWCSDVWFFLIYFPSILSLQSKTSSNCPTTTTPFI